MTGAKHDANAPMECDGDKMTAAEEALCWLLVEKSKAPDDVSYSPNEACQIITDALTAEQAKSTALLEALKEADRAINASYAEAHDEWRGHDKSASRNSDIVFKFREKRKAAIELAEGTQP